MPVILADLLTRLRNPATTAANTQNTILLTGAACADMREAADEIERVTAENERLRAAFDRLMVCGNHIATHHKPNWPPYRLDGLTRGQQCDHVLRTLGATPDYDMWVCWSGMMQERDALYQQNALRQEK